MVKRGFVKVPAIVAALGLALALVLTGCPAEVTPDIGWTAVQTGAGMIGLTFNAPIGGLAHSQISIASPPATAAGAAGALVRWGQPVGGGTTWALPIWVQAGNAGDVHISISADGISSRPVTVAVTAGGTEGALNGITWTANMADTDFFAPGVDTGNIMTFVFSHPVFSLGSGNISFIGDTDGTGGSTGVGGAEVVAAGQPSPSPDHRRWTMPVTVVRPGNVRVFIDAHGINRLGTTGGTPQSVPVALIVPTFSHVAAESAIRIRFSRPISTLALSDIVIEPSTAEFTLGTLTGSGNDWLLPITVTRPGTVLISIPNRVGFAHASGANNLASPATLTLVQNTFTWTIRTDNTPQPGVDAAPLVNRNLQLTFTAPIDGIAANNISFRVAAAATTAWAPDLNRPVVGHGRVWSIPVTATVPPGDTIVNPTGVAIDLAGGIPGVTLGAQ